MIRKTAALAAACLVSFPAYGVDGLAIEVGRGNDRTSLLRVSVQERWRKDPAPSAEWRLAGFWDLSAAIWDNRDESTANVGLTPVFRLQREALYVEAAIGFHLVQTRISAHRVFSTAFQFGDHVGVGLRSGPYQLGVAFQHLSNGGLRRPNPGINFVLIRLQYDLDDSSR